MKTLHEVFGVNKPIIGMLHLSGFGRDEVMEIARREIEIMYRIGVNAVLVENYFGDETDVENALKYLQDNYPDKVYGVNILGDPDVAFDLARKYGAKFVQIDSVCGHALPQHDAELAKYLDRLRGDRDIFLLGGVRFKYTRHLSGRSLEEDLKLGMERCDAIVVTGAGTGISTDLEKIKTFRTILGDFPLIVGAGMTAETAKEQLAFSDGAIVGSYFKEYGEAEYPVDELRVKEFMHRTKGCSRFQYVHKCEDDLFGTYIAPSGGFIDGYKPEMSYPEGVVITKYTGNEEEVTIPSELDGQCVIGIARDVFAEQKQLRSIYMEEGIVRIGVKAFFECENLQTVHFPESLEMIDSDAFSNTALTKLSLPAKLRKIGSYAFCNTQIEEAILPEGLEILGDLSFTECRKLRKVYIPASIECFVDAQAEDGWPMDLIYEQYEPNRNDEDIDEWYKPTDINNYDGSILTFADCPLLTEVEDKYGLNPWQKKNLFDNTPWLKAQETK